MAVLEADAKRPKTDDFPGEMPVLRLGASLLEPLKCYFATGVMGAACSRLFTIIGRIRMLGMIDRWGHNALLVATALLAALVFLLAK